MVYDQHFYLHFYLVVGGKKKQDKLLIFIGRIIKFIVE